jgi:hypothetical protein
MEEQPMADISSFFGAQYHSFMILNNCTGKRASLKGLQGTDGGVT